MFRKLKLFSKPDYVPATMVILLIVCLLGYFYIQNSKEGFESECSPQELDARLASPEKTLVLLYADWCGHCKKIEPEWSDASSKSNGRMLQRNVGAKDVSKETADENKEIMDKFNVDGFPTILVFQNGKVVPYEGSRTADAFLAKLN